MRVIELDRYSFSVLLRTHSEEWHNNQVFDSCNLFFLSTIYVKRKIQQSYLLVKVWWLIEGGCVAIPNCGIVTIEYQIPSLLSIGTTIIWKYMKNPDFPYFLYYANRFIFLVAFWPTPLRPFAFWLFPRLGNLDLVRLNYLLVALRGTGVRVAPISHIHI